MNNLIFEKKIKISDLIFMENNPRYTFSTKSYEFKHIADKEQNLKNAINNLLESEEDLEKLLNLIINFNKVGFDALEDTLPFVIESIFHKGKYIVIEGNRRLLCLKLLSKNIEVLNIFNLYKYNSNEMYGENDKEKIEFDKNKNKIIQIIDNNNNNIITNISFIPVNFFDIKNSSKNDYIHLEKEMISRIISRHTYTESSFKKEWSRVKMFFELRLKFIDILKDELNKLHNYKKSLKKTYDELSDIYKRTLSKIKIDVFTSFYVFNIINNWANEKVNPKAAIKKVKSSSIELSLSKIKNFDKMTLRRKISIQRKTSIRNENIDDTFNLLEMKKISWEYLSKFVMLAYTNGNLNTRRFTLCIKNKENEKIILMMSKIFDSPCKKN